MVRVRDEMGRRVEDEVPWRGFVVADIAAGYGFLCVPVDAYGSMDAYGCRR